MKVVDRDRIINFICKYTEDNLQEIVDMWNTTYNNSNIDMTTDKFEYMINCDEDNVLQYGDYILFYRNGGSFSCSPYSYEHNICNKRWDKFLKEDIIEPLKYDGTNVKWLIEKFPDVKFTESTELFEGGTKYLTTKYDEIRIGDALYRVGDSEDDYEVLNIGSKEFNEEYIIIEG
jgi:hypothetical protein